MGLEKELTPKIERSWRATSPTVAGRGSGAAGGLVCSGQTIDNVAKSNNDPGDSDVGPKICMNQFQIQSKQLLGTYQKSRPI